MKTFASWFSVPALAAFTSGGGSSEYPPGPRFPDPRGGVCSRKGLGGKDQRFPKVAFTVQ